MSRKTIAILSSLVVITLILLLVALLSNNSRIGGISNPTLQTTVSPAPTVVAKSILSLLPNPAAIDATGKGTVTVDITTDINAVTGVQLELQYDPKAISNVVVSPGSFIKSPLVLLNKTDQKTGRITYMMGLPPAQQPVQGTGAIATITFTKVPGTVMKETTLTILPTSLISASGIDSSVLKTSHSTTILLGQ